MSRDPRYQRLLNSKRWKMLRQAYLQDHPKCERCIAEGKAAGIKRGYIHSAIDVHHKVPVESAHSLQEMEALCYDWNNLEALCIPCHSKTHGEQRSHSKEAHKRREEDRLERWKQRQQGKRPSTTGDGSE